jgi:hypothetical protein
LLNTLTMLYKLWDSSDIFLKMNFVVCIHFIYKKFQECNSGLVAKELTLCLHILQEVPSLVKGKMVKKDSKVWGGMGKKRLI